MRIALYSSKRDRCGISTYTTYLEKAFNAIGHEAQHWGSQAPYDHAFSAAMAWKPDVFHFQHEPSIMPPDPVMQKYVKIMRERGIKIMITMHTETPKTFESCRHLVPADSNLIMHRQPSKSIRPVVLPMPCPVLENIPDRAALREKYGYPKDALIISTVGFMIPWKEHPKIVKNMIPWLRKRKKAYLQVIASEHFNTDLTNYAISCRGDIKRFSTDLYNNRVRHIDHYPSDDEVIKRLVISDVGYVWCPFDTGSASAAAAVFTTARCPVIATSSSHYAGLGTGVVRGALENMDSFVSLIQQVADNAELMDKLKKNQEVMYQQRNYLEIARRHIGIYTRNS